MKVGDCALCKASAVNLLDSHYIPRALYKVSRSPQYTNQNPVLVSASTAVITGSQASDHLLCGDCEHRLNDGGERWVISQVWRNTTVFPLRQALVAAGATSVSEPNFLIFEAARIHGIMPDKLAYFAASIFWRGAAHDWTIQGTKHDRLPLGPYREALRLYLIGGSWPQDVILQIHVGNGMEELRNGTTVFPYRRYDKSGVKQYCFTVPGITFYLYVGKAIPAPIRQFCSVRSVQRYVFMVEEVDKGNVQRNLAVFSKTQKVGALAKRLNQPGHAAPSPWTGAELKELLPKKKATKP